MINQIVSSLAGEFAVAYHHARQSEDEGDFDQSDVDYVKAWAFARALVIVARGGVDSPNEQMPRDTAAGELYAAAEGEWNCGAYDTAVLKTVVIDRLEVVAGYDPKQ